MCGGRSIEEAGKDAEEEEVTALGDEVLDVK